MLTRRFRIAVMFAALPFVPFLLFDRLGAQGNCSQALQQAAQETQALQDEGRRAGWTFLRQEAMAPTFDAARKMVDEAVPPPDALRRAQEIKGQLDTWERVVKAFAASLDDFKRCNSTPGCRVMDVVGRQGDAMRYWMQSLMNEGAKAAADRVERASKFLNDYVSRLGTNAQTNTSIAAGCVAQYIDRAPAPPLAPAVVAPPPKGNEPKPQAQPKPKNGGSSTAKTVGVGFAAAGGSIVGALALAKALSPQDDAGTKQCGAKPAFSIPPSSSQLAAMTSWCQCQGFRTAGTVGDGRNVAPPGSGLRTGDFGCVN
jgi:hypothetical protein